MNWSELIQRVSERTGLPYGVVRAALDGLEGAALAALGEGDTVSLKGLGRLDVVEVAPRAIRRIQDQQKLYVGRRQRVRLRPGAPLKRALAERSPEHWRDPAHQAAWRLAETLLSDLELYHGSRAPKLDRDLRAPQVRLQLQTAFGALWERVVRAYDADVPPGVRETADYLAEAALRRWSR